MNFSPRFISRATTYQLHVRHKLNGWRTANHLPCVTDTLFCAFHPIWSFVTNQRPTSIWQKSVQGKRERERESNNVKPFGTCKLLWKAASAKQLPRQRPSLFMKHACPAYACHFTCETCGTEITCAATGKREPGKSPPCPMETNSWLMTRHAISTYKLPAWRSLPAYTLVRL